MRSLSLVSELMLSTCYLKSENISSTKWHSMIVENFELGLHSNNDVVKGNGK